MSVINTDDIKRNDLDEQSIQEELDKEFEKKAESYIQATSFQEFLKEPSVVSNLQSCYWDEMFGVIEPKLYDIISICENNNTDIKESFNLDDSFMNHLTNIVEHHLSDEFVFNKEYIQKHPEVAFSFVEKKINNEDNNNYVNNNKKSVKYIPEKYAKLYNWDARKK